MATGAFPITSRGLLQLPSEIRYHIYALVFQDPKCAISNDTERKRKTKNHFSKLVTFKSSGFPLRLTEVCQLLYEEVVDYMASHLNARLSFDTEDLQLAVQDLVPGHYRARVWHLDTSYMVMEQNTLFNIEFLPNLRSLSVHLGTTLVKSMVDSFDDTFKCDEPGQTIAKYQNVNRYVAQCFSDFEGCETLVNYCRESGIDSTIHFRACFATREDCVYEVQDIELRNSGGKEQELRITTEKLAALQDFDDLKVGTCFVQGDMYLFQESLLKHTRLLRELVGAVGKRNRV